MLSQLSHRAVEWLNGSRGPGDHDTTFHNRQHICGKSFGIRPFRQAMLHLLDALSDR